MICSFRQTAAGYECVYCHRRVKRLVRANCRSLLVPAATPCPLAPILHAAPATADPAAYVGRLRRCLAAGCQLIHRVDGRIVCVGRGRRCQWLGEWARFLAGEEECPHWGESTTASPTPPATPQPPP